MSRVRNAALAGALLVGALQGGVLAGRPAAAASGGPTTPTSPAARRQSVHIDHETAKAAARRYARSLPGPQSGPSRSPSAVCVGASPISDPAGDVPGGQLDAVSYQLAFDCGAPNWTFSVTTAAPWADSALYTFDYFADVDGDLSNNCFGLDRDVFGFWDGGHLVAVVGALTPSCQFVPVASAVISRPNSTRVDMVFSNAALSDPSSLTWYGEISDSPSLAPDDFPDSGGWMVDGPCPTASSSDGTSRYYVADVDAGKAGAALRRAGLRDVKARGGSILTFGGDRGKAARALATVGQRATIAPDYVRAPADTPNDPGFAFQWNFGTFAGSNGVNAEAAWTGTHGSSSIKVAVLDTGADTAHPELTGKLVDPWNVVSGTTDVTDSQGHGTAVSGLIAGVTNNASGLASLGWDTQVMPIKVGNGLFFDSDIILGLDRAIAHGADVVNLSLGGDCNSAPFADAIERVQTSGALVVAAAGNSFSSGNPVFYPAAETGVLGIGATGRDGVHAPYSETGDFVDLVAPGGTGDTAGNNIPVLATGGGTTTNAGTSFSSPTVAAAAALVLAENPLLSPSEAGEILERTAHDLGTAGYDTTYGAGILDAGAAVNAALTTAPRQGTYVPMDPVRILDTRDASFGHFRTPVGNDSAFQVQVAGEGTVPAKGILAVVMNVTVTEPTASGYVTLSPTGLTKGTVSNLNFTAGKTVANLTVVKLGIDGKVNVYNHFGFTHVIADVVGWFSDGSTAVPGARFNPVQPARIYDTRDPAFNPTMQPVPQFGTINVPVAGQGPVPPVGQVSAVVLNVTADQPSASGFLTLYASDATRGSTSNLNFTAGQTVPNLAVVEVGADGKVTVYNHLGHTHVILDVVGWFGVAGAGPATGKRFHALPPTRIFDSRDSSFNPGTQPIGNNTSIAVAVTGVGGVPPVSEVSGVVLNVTVDQPSAVGYLTLYPDLTTKPFVSNLNFVAGQTVPNLAMVKVGANGNVRVYNYSGTTHVILDAVGYYTSSST